MEIISGKIATAQKVVIYGPEGIGKSTFAAQFPEPLFIDTEGSTKNMDLRRAPKPSSWTMLLEEVQEVKRHPELCKTLVIDTVDWAEQMCIEHICALHHKSGVEDFGYGNGYVYVKEELGRFLNRLEDLVDIGINVVLTAHAQIRKFEQPDELGAYDRYELKLGKKTSSQTSPLVKEWADMVLFANYKTYAITTDKEGKKHKAQGGSRVMYTTHHPCWDAKNRHELPDELPFEYGAIAHIFSSQTKSTVPQMNKPDPPVESQANKQPDPPKASVEPPVTPPKDDPPEYNTPAAPMVDERIPKALRDLMIANQVDEWDIQEVVADRGYYPNDVPIINYPQAFIDGVLVAAWDQVYGVIKEMKQNQQLPFN